MTKPNHSKACLGDNEVKVEIHSGEGLDPLSAVKVGHIEIGGRIAHFIVAISFKSSLMGAVFWNQWRNVF